MKGIKHVSVGTQLTQAEYEADTSHDIPSGDTFPTSPSEKDLFFRTDAKLLFQYNGEEWEPVGTSGQGHVQYSHSTEETVSFTDLADYGWLSEVIECFKIGEAYCDAGIHLDRMVGSFEVKSSISGVRAWLFVSYHSTSRSKGTQVSQDPSTLADCLLYDADYNSTTDYATRKLYGLWSYNHSEINENTGVYLTIWLCAENRTGSTQSGTVYAQNIRFLSKVFGLKFGF